jgi:hypothetical protein
MLSDRTWGAASVTCCALTVEITRGDGKDKMSETIKCNAPEYHFCELECEQCGYRGVLEKQKDNPSALITLLGSMFSEIRLWWRCMDSCGKMLIIMAIVSAAVLGATAWCWMEMHTITITAS